MNKNKKVIIALIIAILIIVGIILLITSKPKSNLNVSSIEDLKKLVNQIYEGTESLELPTMMTLELDLEEDWIVEPFTGLENGDDLEYAIASETETVTYPYSLVLAKVKEDIDVEKIAKTMNEKINLSKWGDETAEKVYVTSSGNIICLIMANEEEAKMIYERFKTLAGVIGQEYQKNI